MRTHTVQRWDLDKTYLATDTESLRGLLRIPFERAQDKRALPGVATLIKQLRRSATARGGTTSVNFVTASPPQIGRAIREKLSMDGIEIDEIRFKDQIHHLVRGRFDVLREHIGFKLAELLESARAGLRDGDELLFGDDWESDPLIYSLFADVVERRMSAGRLEALLHRAGVDSANYLAVIRDCVERDGPERCVRAILVLRARPRDPLDFAPFGRRLYWFDNYLEGSLVLHALGDLDPRGVVSVASASGATPDEVATAFEAVATRWPHLRREHLAAAAAALSAAGLLGEVFLGSPVRRAWVRWRVSRGRPPVRRPRAPLAMPDYDRLVLDWAHRPRRDPDPDANGKSAEAGADGKDGKDD